MSLAYASFPFRRLKRSRIRLFSILPGDFNDPICLNLKHVHFGTRPKYIAISYVWGDAADQVKIQMEGCDFSITRGLFRALQRIRELARPGGDLERHSNGMKRPYWFWADAVCINQEDIEEKSRQIPMMMSIYVMSTRMLGWLGDIPPKVDPQSLGQVFRMATCAATEHKDLGPAADKDDSLVEKRDIPQELGSDFYEFANAWYRIILLQWFQRSWIVQEAVGSYDKATLMIGPFSCPLHGLVVISKALITSRRHVNAVLNTSTWEVHAKEVLSLQYLHWKHAEFIRIQQRMEVLQDADLLVVTFGYQLVMVSTQTQRTKATLPHDLIYSKLGIALAPDLPRHLAPDYSVPYAQVCLAYFKLIVQRTKFFIFLPHPWPLRSAGHPSWLPNMGSGKDWIVMRGPGTPDSVTISDNGEILTLGGIQVDSVAKVFTLHTDPLDKPLPQIYGQYSKYLQEVVEPAARFQGCTFDMAKKQWLAQATKRFGLEKDLDLLCEVFERDAGNPYPGQPETMAQFGMALEEYFRRSKTIVTSRGLMLGIGALAKAEPGDVVCMLMAKRNALCLRPRGDHYELIAYCVSYDDRLYELYGDEVFARPDVKKFRLI